MPMTESQAMTLPPPPMVRRTATDLAPEDLQGEFARYGIPGGDMATRTSALQTKYDEEYEALQRAYEERATQEAMKQRKEKYVQAVHAKQDLERAALAREPTIALLVKQLEQNAAPLHLVVHDVSPLACCALLRAMRRNTSVNTLDLSNNRLDDLIATAVGKMLTQNKRLRALQLCANRLSSHTLPAIGSALAVNTTLTSLSLESNTIMVPSTVSADASHGMSTSSSSSTSGGGSAPLQDFETFLAAIAQSRSLTTLNLFNTHMTFDVGRALAKAVEQNTSLIAVEMGGNTIRQGDLATIMTVMKRNQDLAAAAQRKTAHVRAHIHQHAKEVQLDQQRHAKETSNARWHAENARQREEARTREEQAHARQQAEEEMRVAIAIEEDQKKYMDAKAAAAAKLTKKK